MPRFQILSLIAVSALLFTGDAIRAQGIDLLVDQSQSFVDISVLGGKATSSISGTAVIELDPVEEPFSTARITELNMSLADGFSISLLGGAVVVGVEPGNANVFFVEVGDAGVVDANNQFDQIGNLFGVDGMSMVDSFLGDEVIDLATVKPVPFDIIDATLAIDGDMLTVFASVDLDFDFDVIGSTATMNLNGPIVLTGTLPTKKVLLGDVNCDGAVDLLDVAPFVELLTSGGFSVKADINVDGEVDLLDVQPFIALLTN